MKNRFFVLLLALLLLLTACGRGAGAANTDTPVPAATPIAAPDGAVSEAPDGTDVLPLAYTMADQGSEAAADTALCRR